MVHQKRVEIKGLSEHFLDLRDDLGLAAAGDRELLAACAALHDRAGTAEDYLRTIAFCARDLEET
jgi:hypothetical protein